MKKFVDSIIKFRWIIAILIPLMTVAIATNLKHMEFEGSYRIWFEEDAKILTDYDSFRSVFGNDEAVTVLITDEKGIFNKKTLHVIDEITQELWTTKYIARVDSITNYQYVHADIEDPDEVIVEDFIDEIDTLDESALQERARIAVGEDIIINKIISKDTKTTMIAARLIPKSGDDPMAALVITEAVDKILEKYKDSGLIFHKGGSPYLNKTFITLGQHDAATFTPLVLVISMILLWIIFKRASGMLLSISVVIFTFIIVLSVQVLLGYKMNNFTANIPVFVVAIGIADAMHLFWIYLIGRRKGLDNHEAIHYSVHKNFLPVLLTSLTTAIGFASLGISHVVPIKTLGIATANAALLAFILTILFVPAVLAIINPKVKDKEIKGEDHVSPIAIKYANFIVKNDKTLLYASLIIVAFISFGLLHVEVDSNTVRYFDKTVDFRKTVEFSQEHLGGPMVYEVVVDSKRKDGIKDSEFMKTVDKFTEEFKAKYPAVRHTNSLVNVVKNFNKVLDNSKTIPQNSELIAQYLLLYSLSLPQGMEINDMMDVDEQFLRVTCTMDIVDTSLDLEMIEWAQRWWDNTKYSARVDGQTAMFAHMQKDVTDTLLNSIGLAIGLVSLMMLLIFRSIKMIPLFIIPNVLPIVLVVGVMGWLGITIDMGVAISGAIIIGVAVDDTIHFLIKYREARGRGQNLKESLSYVFSYAGSAIIFTTVVLSAAFLIFMFSHFAPNVNFGVVTAIALMIAVLVDLVMLPALLSIVDAKEKSEII